jgi:hypothetical protein
LEAEQDELRRELVGHDVDQPLIDQVVEAGYFAWQIGQLGSGEVRPCVMDSYYGNKYAGLIQLRIPGQGGRDSGIDPVSIPKLIRSRFRDESGQGFRF